MNDQIKYLSYGLLVASVLRSLAFGFTFADVGAILVLSGLAGLISYIEKHKTIQQLVDNQNEQNIVIQKLAQELDHTRTAVAGVKLGMGFQKKN